MAGKRASRKPSRPDPGFEIFRVGFLLGSGRPDPYLAAGMQAAVLCRTAGIAPSEDAVRLAYAALRQVAGAGAKSLAEAIARAGLEPREPG